MVLQQNHVPPRVTNIHNGDWIAVSNVDFGDGASTFAANIASSVGGRIVLRIDSSKGQIIGALDLGSTGSENTWKLLSCNISKVTGVHNLYMIFEGNGGANLFNMDYWKFVK